MACLSSTKAVMLPFAFMNLRKMAFEIISETQKIPGTTVFFSPCIVFFFFQCYNYSHIPFAVKCIAVNIEKTWNFVTGKGLNVSSQPRNLNEREHNKVMHKTQPENCYPPYICYILSTDLHD